MNEEIFDLEGLEALLEAKAYGELTEKERALVAQHIASESEYNDLRDTLKNVKKTFHEEKTALRPKVDMKESLLKKFEDVHGKGNTDAPVKKFHIPVFYRYAGVAAMLILGLFLVVNQYNSKPKKYDPLAMQKPENQQQPATGEISTYKTDSETSYSPPAPVNTQDEKPVTEPVTTVTGNNAPSGYLSQETAIVDEEFSGQGLVLERRENEKVTEDLKIKSKNNLANGDQLDRTMVTEKEEFYTPPGLSSNMYYDYTSGKEKKNDWKEQKQPEKDQGKTTATDDLQKKEEPGPPYQSYGTYFNPYRKGKTDGDLRADQKKAIRKNLIYSDL